MALPAEPEDGQNSERVSDLIVMADHLEHRQGIGHVAFNYLIGEVCSALEQGLEAGNPQIAQRWGGVGTRDYVAKALRGLSEGGFFRRSVYSWREESSGRRRQRRTFNLDRDNELVGRILTARLGPAASSTPPMEADSSSDEPPSAEETQATVVEGEPQVVEQLALVDDDSAAEPEPEATAEATDPEAEATAEATGPEPEATASAADPESEPAAEAAAPPVQNDEDEDYDEPQPRTAPRRRPFTSRLLRS